MPNQRRLIMQGVLCAAVVSMIAAGGCQGVPLQLQRQQIEMGSATISILAPGPFSENTFKIPPSQRSFIQRSEYHTSVKPHVLEVVVGGAQLVQGEASSEGAIKGVMSILKQKDEVKGFEYSTEATNQAGVNGFKVTASWKENGEPRSLGGFYFSKGPEAWQVTVFFYPKDNSSAQAAAEVLKSIEVKFK